jgi:glyoxylase-like metal-dependent hydrolase (beta-lactamase superfamily II)
MCPHGRALFQAQGGLLDTFELCCHCLLIESELGLVLVDSGLSLADLDPRRSRIPFALRVLVRPTLDPQRSAIRRIEALGFQARDVRHIVLTHLDFDHAGGIADFPEAEVHVFRDELQAALRPPTPREKQRYLQHCWSSDTRWSEHAELGENFFGLEAVRALHARENDILLVPTRGHSRGHVAVAVRRGAGWIVHCGDAYFHRDEMAQPPSCPPGFALFQRAMAVDNSARLKNQARLRALKHSHGHALQLFSAHDPLELALMQQLSIAAGGPA